MRALRFFLPKVNGLNPGKLKYIIKILGVIQDLQANQHIQSGPPELC